MAFQAKILAITQKTTTGSQSYTGAAFQPKALICLGSQRGAVGSQSGSAISVGLAGTSGQFSSCSSMSDATAGASVVAVQAETLLCQTINTDGTATLTGTASLTSLDADGFTLNWVTTDGTARVWLVLCLGGADLTNTIMKAGTQPAVTGNHAMTGFGFQPSVALLLAQIFAGADPVAIGFANSTQFLGAATSSTNRFYTAGRQRNGLNPTVARAVQKGTGCLGFISDAGISAEADFVSFESGGMTLNFSSTLGDGPYGILALAGIRARVLSFTSPAATGNQSYTGAGFTPVAAIFSSACGVSSTANVAHCRRMIGLATSSTNRGVLSWADADAVTGSSNTSQDLDQTKCVKHIVEGHAAPTFPSTADFVSFDPDGLTLNWTAADATARETFVLLLGHAAAPPGGGVDTFAGAWSMQSLLPVAQVPLMVSSGAGTRTRIPQ